MAIEQDIAIWLERQSVNLQIQDVQGRKALLFSAGLEEVQTVIVLEGATFVFCQELVQQLQQYGVLSDGRDPLTAVLETAKTMVGRDKQAECDALIARLQSAPRSRQAGWPSTTPCHLPPLDEHFVDREQQLADLLDMLHPGKVVTLCGPGGIGKSALAAQAVRQIEPERFPDGILFHSFYQQPDPLIALEYIARSFGVEPKPEPSAAARMALGRKRALLILDGAEEADDLGPVLNIRGDCGVLITSRRKQDALACRLDIPPLARAAAADLLQAWGGSQLASAALTQQICERLGGWPLAIRLAGHYVNESGETASEYLEWLETQPIEALDHGDHRDSSVNVLLRRSVEQVSARARQVLAVVGQLAFAPLRAEPIAAALGCEMRQCRTAFAELVNYGLLQRTDDQRYEVSHAFIHAYARTHLPLQPEHLSALAAYYREFAKAQSQQGRTGYIALDAERTHIVQILATCQEQQMWPMVNDLVKSIWKYLDLCGYWTEYHTVLNMNLIAAQKQEDRRDEGWCLGSLGYNAIHRGDYATALAYLEQSLPIQQEIGDKAGEGTALNNISQIYDARGDYATALEYLEQSLAIRQEIGDKAGEGATLNNLAATAYAGGDYATALEYLEQSLAIQQEIGDKAGEGATLNNISQIFKARGDYATALEYLQQSLAIRQEIGDKAGEGATLNNISQIYAARGDYATALEYLEQSLAIRQEIGDKAGEGTTLNNISQIYDARGDYATALEYLEQSLAIQQEIGDKAGEGATLNNIGNIYRAWGDYEKALPYLEQSLAISREIGDKAGEGPTLNSISLIFKARGDYATALEYLEQSLAIQQEIGDKAGEGATLNNLSQIYAARGDYATALEYLEQSLAIQQEIGDKAGEGTTLNNLATTAYAGGDYATALEYLEQSLAIQQEIGDIAGMCATLFNMGHIYHQNEEVPQAFEAWVAVYRLAKPRNLAEILDALENLAGQLGLPGGLEAWEKLAAVIAQP